LVENQIGNKIKILRIDNGTKYESNEFNDYCREDGINRETTTAYTPDQNAVVQRKNLSIIEATHAMLHDQGLPKFLWGEAPNTVVYVQNRCPHQALDSKIPEEVFISKKLDVSHLEFLVAPCIFMCQKKREANWMQLGIKEHLRAIMKPQRHIESMFLVKEK